MQSKQIKIMCDLRTLLTKICVVVMMSGCATSQVSGITETARPTDQRCPQRNVDKSPFQVSPAGNSSLSELRFEIEGYLNSGGSASGLQSLIVDDQNNTIGSIIEVDLNSDGIDEIVLSTTTSNDTDGHLSGWVGIYRCELGKYSASYTELGQFMEYVKVKSIQDALDLGTPQVFVEYEWHGWSCTVGLQVLALFSDKWSWVFGNYLNCPASVSIHVNQITGKTEIIYEGILHDVMGNEPDKEVTQIYTVNNGEFQLQP